MIRVSAILACVIGVLLGSGCASSGASSSVAVAPGGYARAFDETREVLRDMGFILDRVDAQAGVITTQPKGSGGLATPWDREQTSLGGEFEDAVHRHRRVVRVEFAPAPPGSEPAGPEGPDLRIAKGALGAQVSVAVYRWQQPGWRVNTEAILNSTYTHDPQLDERGMGSYGVAVRQDGDLAREIARQINSRLGATTRGG